MQPRVDGCVWESWSWRNKILSWQAGSTAWFFCRADSIAWFFCRGTFGKNGHVKIACQQLKLAKKVSGKGVMITFVSDRLPIAGVVLL